MVSCWNSMFFENEDSGLNMAVQYFVVELRLTDVTFFRYCI